MDYVNNYFIVQNSSGLEWGVDGIGNVDCDLIFNVLEPSIDDDRNRGLQGLHDHGLYSPKELRELKRLEQGNLGTSMARPVVAKVKYSKLLASNYYKVLLYPVMYVLNHRYAYAQLRCYFACYTNYNLSFTPLVLDFILRLKKTFSLVRRIV